jgi:hypothetical protein
MLVYWYRDFYYYTKDSKQSESLDSNTGEKELIMVWKR